jgi:Family of unknown function (DUF6159)
MFAHTLQRASNGWALGREAVAVMKQHPKLAVFPILSGLSFTALLVGIATGAFLRPELFGISVEHGANGGFSAHGSEFSLLWGLGLYLILVFVSTFFNTALCGTILARQLTGRVSLRDGFMAALRRLPQILSWSLFAATIGIGLAMLKDWLGKYLSWFGWIFGSLFETAWAATIYFVAPVLAVEGVGPFTAIKRSAGLLKSRWGETAGAEFSTIWALWPLHLVGLLSFLGLTFSGFFTRGGALVGAMLISMIMFVLYLVVSVVLHSIMSGVIKSHLYLYAKTGDVPVGSDPALYARAFGAK